MKIMLVNAASYSPHAEKTYPLGVLFLAARLRETGQAQVVIDDMQLDTGNVDRVVARLQNERPDVLGISAMTCDAPLVHELAERSKRACPHIPVLVGGSHATCYPDDVMQDTNVDYVLRGESEVALANLLSYLGGERKAEALTSCVYRHNGALRYSPMEPPIEDLDALPFPGYDQIDMERYFDLPRIGVIYTHKRYVTLSTSRGCPFQCAYCHNIHGKRLRKNSADYVLAQMEWLTKRFQVREFVFVEDIFNLDRERTHAIARGIVRRKMNVALAFVNGMRGDIMDEETLRLLKEAGMYRCMFAFETGSERLQKLIRKNLNIGKVLETVDQAARMGILTNGAFMLGFPTETFEEMRATVRLAVRSRLHSAAFLRVIPFKNTELFDLAVQHGGIVGEDFSQFTLVQNTKVNVSRVPEWKIRLLKRWGFFRFYASPNRLWHIVRLFPNKRTQTVSTLRFLWRKAFVW